MSELKPCPFCGSKPVLTQDATASRDGFDEYSVSCENAECLVNACTWGFESGDKAVEAWNTRAERTCHVVIEDECPVCSECGEDINPSFAACPYCGARVVES